ncbi:tetratricopeptide repeat protein [bacterium]|nr:tetratricopeptide repeat protein [bacterium]
MSARPQPPPPSGRSAAWPLLPLAVAVVVFACFAPALGHDFVVWDDELNFTLNAYYRGLSWAHLRWMATTFHMGHYQPLTWVTLGLDYLLWGMDARGYHLTNVLLHTANAVLFYWICLRLLRLAHGSRGAPAPDGARLRWTAAAAALFFAIHPLRVESVAWVSERRDVLSGLFYLSAILAYLRMQAAPRPSPVRRRWHAASVGLLVLSLSAKAWGMTLPVVLLALDAYPLRRPAPGETRAALLAEKLPWLAAAAIAAVLAFLAQRQGAEMLSLEQHGIAARAAQAAWGLCFYLGKTLLPIQLSPVYPLDPHLDAARPAYLAAAAVVLAITAAAIAGWRRWPWLAVSWLCFAAVVSPVLGVAQTGPQAAADRYTYLSCLPFALLAAAALGRLAERQARLAAAAAMAALIVLAALTARQVRIWSDSIALWNHALALDAENAIAHVNRGTAWEAKGDLDRAAADYAAAIDRDPRYADAYFGRGNVQRTRGDLDGAFADYDAFVRLRPHDPKGYANRGGVRHLQGDLEGAAADYRRALDLAPWDWAFRDTVTGNLAQLGGH